MGRIFVSKDSAVVKNVFTRILVGVKNIKQILELSKSCLYRSGSVVYKADASHPVDLGLIFFSTHTKDFSKRYS